MSFRSAARQAWRALPLTLLLAATYTAPAHAHRSWLLPSATVLSGETPWVTVDAAVSNDLFYFEHVAMRLDGLQAWGPDGKPVKPENLATGRYRSTFDVKLAAPGTYRLAVQNDTLFATFRVNGENKRLRGTTESLRKEIPAGAENLQVSRNQGRTETFVTAGKPTRDVLKPQGNGLELAPVTHPNDLVVDEEAVFALVFDGKPVANVPVTVIPGGIRYRDQLDEQTVQTDARGEFRVKWATPGMYWINATYPARPARAAGAGGPGAGGPGGAGAGGPGASAPAGAGGTLDAPVRRGSYALTIEVLPQ